MNKQFDENNRRPWTEDLTGLKFNHITVIRLLRVDKKKGNIWEYICDCGKILSGDSYRIKNIIKSCGCFRKTVATHGKSKTRMHRIWWAMKMRCGNPNTPSYKNYGRRGIKVCSEWEKSFSSFYQDMSAGYADNLELNRINNDGGYCKENCNWVTREIQVKNKRNNVWYEVDGIKMIKEDWAKSLGVSSPKINQKLKAGYSFEQIVWYYRNCKKGSRIKYQLLYAGM